MNRAFKVARRDAVASISLLSRRMEGKHAGGDGTAIGWLRRLVGTAAAARRDQANIFFRGSCQHHPMEDHDHNSMDTILTGIRRDFRAEPSRVWTPSRAPEPSRMEEPARVIEPTRSSDPARQVDYIWEATRSIL